MKMFDQSCINFVIAQKTLPWQPILQAKVAKLADLISFIALAFRNKLQYCNANWHINSIMNWHT